MDVSQKIARCYDTHALALYAHALVMTSDPADAEEVLQTVFTRLIRKPNALQSARDEKAVLMKWVHDAAVDLIRSNARRRDRNETWQANTVSPFAKTEDPDKDDYAKAAWEALNQLPEAQRSVVHLRLWEGYTFETIASTLNISINTAGSRFRYGIDKMRERLRPLYEELKDYHGCL